MPKPKATAAESGVTLVSQSAQGQLTEALQHWAAKALGFSDSPAARWGVAYSGGADSTALLWAAQTQWPGRVVAFHVNHGLQEAAAEFQRCAQAVCDAWGVPLHVASPEARHATGESPEEAARRARFQALAELAKCHGVQAVLLGQHADDQLETLLLALTRGAGLPGLASMPASFRRHGVDFGRPFLALKSTDIRKAVQALGLPFIDDPTNTDKRFTRNKIRLEVVPALLEAFPTARNTFARSARHAADAQALLAERAQEDLLNTGNPPALKAVRSLGHLRQANLLRYWLKSTWQTTPTEAQLNEALRQIAACSTRGHQIHLKVASGFLSRRGGCLHFEPLGAC